MTEPNIRDCILQYFRCPEEFAPFALKGQLRSNSGYFRFGETTICYGSYIGRRPASQPSGLLPDALRDVEIHDGLVYLPFDPSQVADSFRREMYTPDWRAQMPVSLLARMYYAVRPLLPTTIRKHLHEIYFRGWDRLAFPRWPVDSSVDDLFVQLLALSLKATGNERIPFIWFWPYGAPSCAIMTHDVETRAASDCCEQLMDIDDSYQIKSSFQVIPESHAAIRADLLESMRARGFEIAVHDLPHDGRSHKDYGRFLDRAAAINACAQEYGALGFRADFPYRKQLWYDELKIAYDMSVPNVAHLDPQRGGCCTVMPHFLGEVLELPVTTTQDHTLFHILGDCSIDLWKKQISLIHEKHGLMSFAVHPDCVADPERRSIYEALLGYLSCFQDEQDLWLTTPGEVNRWWRQRWNMKLVRRFGEFCIEGPGSDRACLAYAMLDGDRMIFDLQRTAASKHQDS